MNNLPRLSKGSARRHSGQRHDQRAIPLQAFLKRETPVTCQQIFAALRAREELEYSLPDDKEPYRASARSRFGSPEFYALFASTLRMLKLFP